MAVDGVPLVDFPDFIAGSKPHSVTSPDDIINATQQNTYFIGTLIENKKPEMVVQNGQKIVIPIRLDKSNSAGPYLPGQTITPGGLTVATLANVNWRFNQSNYGWNEQMLELNSGDAMDNYIKLSELWRGTCEQAHYESLENQIWGTPSFNDMEDAEGKLAYSIPALVSDNGIAYDNTWTTVMGINPIVKTNWRNKIGSYDHSNISTTLLTAMDSMYANLEWKKPAKSGKWAVNIDPSKDSSIATDLNGRNQYISTSRADGNRTVPIPSSGAGDPGSWSRRPTYEGIEINRISALDNLGWAKGYSKYYWLTHQSLSPVFHSRKFMLETDPIRQPGQPFTWACFWDTYWNLCVLDRRRNGVITAF